MSVSRVALLSAPDVELEPTLELAATLYLPAGEPAKPAPGLIVGHGAGSRRERHDEFCREACRAGFAVLALDFRGHGESGGEGDGPFEQDVLAAARFLRTHPAVDGARLCYRGSGMGGFYGLKAAPQAGFAAMALLCAASEEVVLDALADEDGSDATGVTDASLPVEAAPSGPVATRYARPRGLAPSSTPAAPPRWDMPRLRTYFAQQDSRLLAAQVGCPVLLVHARGDEVVPFAHSLLLAGYLPAETTLLALEGGSHTSAQHDPRVHRYTAAWLLEKAGGIPASACTACI